MTSSCQNAEVLDEAGGLPRQIYGSSSGQRKASFDLEATSSPREIPSTMGTPLLPESPPSAGNLSSPAKANFFGGSFSSKSSLKSQLPYPIIGLRSLSKIGVFKFADLSTRQRLTMRIQNIKKKIKGKLEAVQLPAAGSIGLQQLTDDYLDPDEAEITKDSFTSHGMHDYRSLSMPSFDEFRREADAVHGLRAMQQSEDQSFLRSNPSVSPAAHFPRVGECPPRGMVIHPDLLDEDPVPEDDGLFRKVRLSNDQSTSWRKSAASRDTDKSWLDDRPRPLAAPPFLYEPPPPGIVRHPDASVKRTQFRSPFSLSSSAVDQLSSQTPSPPRTPSSPRTPSPSARIAFTRDHSPPDSPLVVDTEKTSPVEYIDAVSGRGLPLITIAQDSPDDKSWLNDRLQLPAQCPYPACGHDAPARTAAVKEVLLAADDPEAFDRVAIRRASQKARDLADGYFWLEEQRSTRVEAFPARSSAWPRCPTEAGELGDVEESGVSCAWIDDDDYVLPEQPDSLKATSLTGSASPADLARLREDVAIELKTSTGSRPGSRRTSVDATASGKMKAPAKPLQPLALHPQEVPARYSIVNGRVYEYVDGDARAIDWNELDVHYGARNCHCVQPISRKDGEFLVGYRTGHGLIRVERRCLQSSVPEVLCEAMFISRNRSFAVDSDRFVRQLAAPREGGDHTNRPRVPETFEKVFDITEDHDQRLLVYGQENSCRTIRFIDDGPQLQFEDASRLEQCLDVVHIPHSSIIYLVWLGHIEVRRFAPDEVVPASPQNVFFLPRRTQVKEVIHGFSDSRGLVVWVRDTWTDRESIIRFSYATFTWGILIPMDAELISYDRQIETAV